MAKKQALSLVESLREPGLIQRDTADQAMVIAFDSTAEVVQQFTTDKKLLKAAIDSITQTDAPTSLKEAMRLAKAHAPHKIVEGKPVEGWTAGFPPISTCGPTGGSPTARNPRLPRTTRSCSTAWACPSR